MGGPSRVIAMSRESVRAAAWGLAATAALTALIVLGSRNLDHFDAALVGYLFATLFAVFGITYRYAMWLQRPPTRMYWRRGWQAFLRRGHRARNLARWPAHPRARFACLAAACRVSSASAPTPWGRVPWDRALPRCGSRPRSVHSFPALWVTATAELRSTRRWSPVGP